MAEMHVVLRYHEIALKGRNRPVLRGAAGPERPPAPGRPGRPGPRPGRPPARRSARRRARGRKRERRLGDLFGVANFSRAHEVPLDFAALEREATAAVPPAAPPPSASPPGGRSRASLSPRPRSSASWARPSTWPPASRCASRSPTSPSTSRCCADRILYSFERQPGAGGFPVGSSGPRGRPPLRRDRLAGGGLAHDEARLHRPPHPLPRLPPPGPHHHRQGDGAGADPDALPAPHPPAARALRRGPADDRRLLPGPAARRPLPPLHGAHRRGPGRAPPGASAGHRREPGPGGLADPGQHDRHRRGRARPGPPAPGRNGQGGDHGCRPVASARSRSARCPTRTAASSSCRAAPPPRPPSRRCGGRSRSWTWTAWCRAPRGRPRKSVSSFPRSACRRRPMPPRTFRYNPRP